MKILAFSDWRVQPLDMIIDLVATHKPDVILYAGDDLDRFIPPDKFLLLKTPTHLLKLNYPDLIPVSIKENRILTQKFKKFIQEIRFQSNDILQQFGVPVYYVNGNDDPVLYAESSYYTRIHKGHIFINGERFSILETSKGKVTIEKMDGVDGICQLDSNGDIKAVVTPIGIYAPITPSFGKFTIQKNDEKITVFGSGCESGLQNKINNEPEEYADIFLSHLPPLGTLDLSARSGVNHIGSKELLDAVKKYHPKLVICGHSHIWGRSSKKIGDSLVINVSSNDRDPSRGNYAIINTDDWSVELKTEEAKTIPIIRGLSTIQSNLRSMLNERYTIDKNGNLLRKVDVNKKCEGIEEALQDIYQWKLHNPPTNEKISETLGEIKRLGVNTERVKERIESLTWEKPKITRRITINPDAHAFVDVETGLANGHEPGKLWLIGLWYNGDLRQFIFPKEKKEFLKYLKQNQITSLVSWTGYDREALSPITERAKMGIKFIDACQRTSNCVIWHSYKLYDLYNALFPTENDTGDFIQGYLAGLYADHLIIPNKSCQFCPPKEKIMEQIKEKNKVDILQMIEICRLLWMDEGCIKIHRSSRRCDENKEYNDFIKNLTQADVLVKVESYRIAISKKYRGKLDKSHINKMIKDYGQNLLKKEG